VGGVFTVGFPFPARKGDVERRVAVLAGDKQEYGLFCIDICHLFRVKLAISGHARLIEPLGLVRYPRPDVLIIATHGRFPWFSCTNGQGLGKFRQLSTGLRIPQPDAGRGVCQTLPLWRLISGEKR
jgi:hypothetical protein